MEGPERRYGSLKAEELSCSRSAVDEWQLQMTSVLLEKISGLCQTKPLEAENLVHGRFLMQWICCGIRSYGNKLRECQLLLAWRSTCTVYSNLEYDQEI